MKCAKVFGSAAVCSPYRLRGQQLALALLLRDKPRTAAQLAAALTEKGYPLRLTDAGKIAGPPDKAWYPLGLRRRLPLHVP